MVDGRHHEKSKNGNVLTDWHEIWHYDAYLPYEPYRHFKI